MGFDPVSAVASAVVGNVVNKAFGGGGGGGGGGGSSSGTVSRPTTTTETVAGSEFQPFTYTGAGGTVRGVQKGDYGYEWSADLPEFIKQLGTAGAVSPTLFNEYYSQVVRDPYETGQEFYTRGLEQLQPEFAKQQIQAQQRMFGGGRLGLNLAGQAVGAPVGTGAVSPDAFGLGAAQSKALTDLYRTSLSEGQALQTNRLNQLAQAAEAAKNLGMLPMQYEQNLIDFAKNLEIARSNAPKTYTQQMAYAETPQSIYAGELSNTIGGLAGQAIGNLWTGTPMGYTGGWVNPDSMSAGVSNFFGGLFS